MTRLLVVPVVAAIASCGAPDVPIEIPFKAVDSGVEAGCDVPGAALQLTDMRLYISEVELLDERGAAAPLRLLPDGQWQSRRVGLVDLENGAGACSNGTAVTNDRLRGEVRAGNYTGIRFTVGVPFDLNHADPLQADPPLDDAAMHWHWRSGYKFLRAGVKTAEDGFWLHLGSAGCEGTVQNISTCRYPNRVVVELSGFAPGRDVVAIDLRELLVGTSLDDSTATDCSSGPGETACGAPFARLGVDHESGAGYGSQSVFRIGAR